MLPRVRESGLPYEESRLLRIGQLVAAEPIDYYALVAEVETIF